MLGFKNWYFHPFFQKIDSISEFLTVFPISMGVSAENDDKYHHENNFMSFQFCMKDIGDSHGSLAGMSKVTSSVIHKNAHISRTTEYFYMHFFLLSFSLHKRFPSRH